MFKNLNCSIGYIIDLIIFKFPNFKFDWKELKKLECSQISVGLKLTSFDLGEKGDVRYQKYVVNTFTNLKNELQISNPVKIGTLSDSSEDDSLLGDSLLDDEM